MVGHLQSRFVWNVHKCLRKNGVDYLKLRKMVFVKNLLVAVALLLLVIRGSQTAITLQQMMEAGKLMRQSCQPKFKISDDIADGIRDGKIPDTKDVKCYINCILEMTNAMKRGKYQLELALKQVELMIPDDMKDEYQTAILTCKDAGNGFKNACDVSYEILKCFYQNAPRFVFP